MMSAPENLSFWCIEVVLGNIRPLASLGLVGIEDIAVQTICRTAAASHWQLWLCNSRLIILDELYRP